MKRRRWMAVALALFVTMVTSGLRAEIYTWTDASGKKHFSDKKPPNQSAETMKTRVNTYEEVSFDVAPAAQPSEQVVMYATEWCGYCKKARRYFRNNNIAFVEYDIEKDAVAKQAYDRIGGRGVPVILVGQRRMNGFSEAGFKQIYQP